MIAASKPGANRADAVLQAECFRAYGIAGDHRGHGVLAALANTIHEFPGVAAVRAGHCVSAKHNSQPACGQGVTEQFQHDHDS